MNRKYYEQEITNILNETDDMTVSDYILNETIIMLMQINNDEDLRSIYELTKGLLN